MIVIVKAEGEEGISVVERASEALREMNLVEDSIAGVHRSLAH